MSTLTKAIITVIIVILIIAGATYLVMMRSTPATSENNQQNNVENTQQVQTQIPSIFVISISNFSFDPTTLTIPAGKTVKWTNQDTATHQIKSDTFNSTALKKLDTYQYTFKTPGTYEYTCSLHPTMKGKIIVTP